MINVVVILFQGVIEDVAAFHDESDALPFFNQETGIPYEEYRRRIDVEDSETILGDYAGSNIWELEVK